MAILSFQKPEKVIVNAATETEGQFEFRPLEPGFGLTIGNALRRVLLSSLEGYAFTSVRISGVDHEFSTLKGVVEDVTEIVLNLKQVRLKRQIDASEGETVKVVISGKDAFKAGDLSAFLTKFANGTQICCRMKIRGSSALFLMQIRHCAQARFIFGQILNGKYMLPQATTMMHCSFLTPNTAF